MGKRLIYRIIERSYGLREDSILNVGDTAQETPALSTERLWETMAALKTMVSPEQKGRVNYTEISHSDTYQAFLRLTTGLKRFDPGTLSSREERMAFWINLYNALIIEGVIRFGVRKSVQNMRGFFLKAAYNIGGQRYAANDIEHGILRANRGYPVIPGPQFGSHDPRRTFCLEELDPRLHFALNCASVSCPPVAFYTPQALDQQLDLAAQNTINSGNDIFDVERNEAQLSRIFLWYAGDFGGAPLGLGNQEPVLAFIAGYLVNKEMATQITSQGVKVRYNVYDWSLNSNQTRSLESK
jgi:hypothetical protein